MMRARGLLLRTRVCLGVRLGMFVGLGLRILLRHLWFMLSQLRLLYLLGQSLCVIKHK